MDVPKKITKALEGHGWFLTGSAAYFSRSAHDPSDMDICVGVDEQHGSLTEGLEKIGLFVAGAYDLPFEWGGRTYERLLSTKDMGLKKKWDIFLVEHRAFQAIQAATASMAYLSAGKPKGCVKDKIARIDLFISLAGFYYREAKRKATND